MPTKLAYIFFLLFLTTAQAQPPSIPLPVQSIKQHKNWIQSCSDSSVAVTRSGLILYAFELGPDSDDVIRCLLSGRDASSGIQISDSEAAVAYLSPFDGIILGDGPQRQMFEALIQTSTKALIVSGVESDGGITRIRHISGNAFVVESDYATHNRLYLVFADSGELAYLTNGYEVEVVDRENFVFRVKDRKSFLKNIGGAFWFDAIVDRDGNILEIVTPTEGNFVECMSREELARKSSLDLSRVVSREICIRR